MIPEIGQFLLALALAVTCVQATLPIIGAIRGYDNWMALAKPAARIQFVLVLSAFAILVHAFVTNDFSVAYVAQNSNSALPTAYRVSAVWGAHEGSLLLWILILCGWTVAVTFFDKELPRSFAALVVSVMGIVSVGFISFMLFTSNPFARLLPAAGDGGDLNPLLQDPGLIIHPPMLYIGYVGTSVAFGFAIAALIQGRITAQAARWIRPWAIGSWIFLTIGIALGSWWAYYELGWGGWWFWDPVENASFMPWLLGTALIHSLAVTEKRGAFKNWTILLALATFALSLLGTFLVRSGVLTSVHAFATDPGRGVFVLVLLGTVIGGSLILYAWRGPSTFAGGRYEPVSREIFLLLNSALLAVATATVLLGTLYPLFLEALGLGKISVGPPYFNVVFSAVMLPLIALMGFGQFSRWKSDSLRRLAIQVKYAFVAAIGIAIVAVMLLGGEKIVSAGIGIGFGAWIMVTIVAGIFERCRNRRNPWYAFFHLPRAFVGQCIAHVGFASTVIGVVITSFYTVDLHQKLAPGEQATIANYEFHFTKLSSFDGPNYKVTEATFEIYRDGQLVDVLKPQKRLYLVRNMPMTEAGIAPGFTRDLYVALGEPLADGAWSVRMHFKPFIRWIWLGAILMALGGFIAIFDPRLRSPSAVRREAIAPAQPSSD
ncbi:MAG: cytochrome c-type biogenesis protein CcmF [Gammaproteobacteria bacterium]|jgi:cytochrome c-type biogenesis protein CcmF